MTLRLYPNIFEKAADLIDANGLAKKAYKDAEGCFCTLGALNAALDNGFTGSETGEPGIAHEGMNEWLNYVGHLASVLPDGYTDVPEWNDEPERTKEEVSAFLRKAAADLWEEYSSHYYA
ncbi:hypothetical protein ACFY2K_26355 [Kitasatospora sp. NPDC001309]|uniref:DUF6197 family protein n=1 Tax=Kitasatospora sp. NPDC001309 TaxID=3364013 RepID=UPI0036B6FDE4